jgi:hypothetical protein
MHLDLLYVRQSLVGFAAPLAGWVMINFGMGLSALG